MEVDKLANDLGLFANNGETPAMPTPDIKVKNPNNPDGELLSSHSVSNGHSLISSGVEEAIKGDTVKSIIIPETVDLLLPNYVLDFRKASIIKKHQVNALVSMLTDEGDCAIYFYLPNGLERVGMAIGSVMDRVLPAGVQSIFGGACKLYQDVEKDKPLKEIKQQDISKIRLRI